MTMKNGAVVPSTIAFPGPARTIASVKPPRKTATIVRPLTAVQSQTDAERGSRARRSGSAASSTTAVGAARRLVSVSGPASEPASAVTRGVQPQATTDVARSSAGASDGRARAVALPIGQPYRVLALETRRGADVGDGGAEIGLSAGLSGRVQHDRGGRGRSRRPGRRRSRPPDHARVPLRALPALRAADPPRPAPPPSARARAEVGRARARVVGRGARPDCVSLSRDRRGARAGGDPPVPLLRQHGRARDELRRPALEPD